MPEVHPIVHFLWAVAQFLTGVFANSIIVVANATELKKQRKVAPLDLLLSCLATSRICLQLVIFYIHLVILSLVKQLIRVENFLIFLFVNDSGLWLATWLGVFYCAKIATFPHPLFLWLKRRIGKLVPWLILESVLGAAVSTGVQGSCALIFSEEFVGKFFFRNATEIQGVYIMPLALFITGVLLPLILFLASALLLIVSLGRHTQQMGAVASSVGDPRRRAHIRALLSLLSFLILYCSHYSVTILLSCQVLEFGSFAFQLCTWLAGTYPSAHSIILILGNPKLKQNAKKFLLRAKCYQ